MHYAFDRQCYPHSTFYLYNSNNIMIELSNITNI